MPKNLTPEDVALLPSPGCVDSETVVCLDALHIYHFLFPPEISHRVRLHGLPTTLSFHFSIRMGACIVNYGLCDPQPKRILQFVQTNLSFHQMKGGLSFSVMFDQYFVLTPSLSGTQKTICHSKKNFVVNDNECMMWG
jgi:hypothetical protein